VAILADGAVQPVLLRSSTGSGKTLMIVKAIEAVCRKRKIVWFWFAPFTGLVDQTIRVINDYGHDLTAAPLATHRAWSGHASGQVFVSTAQAIASGEANIHADSDDLPSLVSLVRNIRAAALIVVDEAHIGVDRPRRRSRGRAQ
jgi:type III restriction enzyme